MAWFARQKRLDVQTGAINGGYTLRRMDPTADRKTRKEIEVDAMEGYLFFYHDITTPGNR